MPYKITLEKKNTLPGALRNKNTQPGFSPMNQLSRVNWELGYLFASDNS